MTETRIDRRFSALKKEGRAGLVTSLIANLGILGVFKYYDFFIESAEDLWIALEYHHKRDLQEQREFRAGY